MNGAVKEDGGRGQGSERSRRLNREEIECSSNIEEDSGFARIEGRNVSIRPLLDSSGVHRLPLLHRERERESSVDSARSEVLIRRCGFCFNTRGKFTYCKYG